jgi:hypothetical protein
MIVVPFTLSLEFIGKRAKNDGHGFFSPIISLKDEIVSKEACDFS